MPNRPTITVYKKMDRKLKLIDYQVEIYDDNVHTYFLFPDESHIPENDMELLEARIKASHDTGTHGTACDDVRDILAYVRENKCAMRIDDTLYQWDDIKETMKYDFRNLYACPVCGWESYDDDCGDCPDCEDGGQMHFMEQEHYKKKKNSFI